MFKECNKSDDHSKKQLILKFFNTLLSLLIFKLSEQVSTFPCDGKDFVYSH